MPYRRQCRDSLGALGGWLSSPYFLRDLLGGRTGSCKSSTKPGARSQEKVERSQASLGGVSRCSESAGVSFVLLKTGRIELVQLNIPTFPSTAEVRALPEAHTPRSDSERTLRSMDPLRSSGRRGRERNGQLPRSGRYHRV